MIEFMYEDIPISEMSDFYDGYYHYAELWVRNVWNNDWNYSLYSVSSRKVKELKKLGWSQNRYAHHYLDGAKEEDRKILTDIFHVEEIEDDSKFDIRKCEYLYIPRDIWQFIRVKIDRFLYTLFISKFNRLIYPFHRDRRVRLNLQNDRWLRKEAARIIYKSEMYKFKHATDKSEFYSNYEA